MKKRTKKRVKRLSKKVQAIGANVEFMRLCLSYND